MSRATQKNQGVFDLDSLRFPDDFEEYLARAESGGSTFGILKRHAFAHSSLRVKPTYGLLRERADQRKRSKSLIPPGSRLTSLADEKSIIKELFEHTAGAAKNQSTEPPLPTLSPQVRSTLQVQPQRKEPPVGYYRNFSAPCSSTQQWREKGIAEEPEIPLLIRSASTRASPKGTGTRDGGPEEVPMCRRRSFSLTHRGLVNEGDEVVPSIPTALEMMREGVGVLMDGGGGSRRSSYNSAEGSGGNWSERSSSFEFPVVHRIMLLGGPGVGKTAIAQQFLTSEFMAAQNTSFDDGRELSVPVLLDGEESIMEFVDLPYSGEPDVWQDYTVDGHIIVYAITDRRSFQKAADVLQDIRSKTRNKSRPIILVANKSDLERSRMITKDEGRNLAQASDCKYIEVSAILNHKVDDLLVGMLKQIRLNLEKETNTGRHRPPTGDPAIDPISSPDAPGPGSRQAVAPASQPAKASSVWSGHSLLSRLFGAGRKSSMKSCEDLLT